MKPHPKESIFFSLAFCILFSLIYFSTFWCLNLVENHLVFIIIANIILWTAVWSIGLSQVFRKFFPMETGIHNFSSSAYLGWRIQQVLLSFGKLTLFNLIPFIFRPILFSAYGGKLGKGVAIAGNLSDPSMVTIGDYGIIGEESLILGHVLTGGKIFLGPVSIEKNAVVGVGSVVLPGCILKEGSVLLPLSVLPRNTTIGPNEVWQGNPAVFIKKNKHEFER